MRSTILALALLATAQLTAQEQQGWSVTRGGYAPWQADDKRLHFQTGFIGGMFELAALERMHVKRPWIWVVLTGLVVGFSKELWDRHHHGSPELMDALNTAAGFAAPCVVFRVRW